MFTCECFRIDGPYIGADPNCPRHGVEATIRSEKIDSLRVRVENLASAEARELLNEILDLME